MYELSTYFMNLSLKEGLGETRGFQLWVISFPFALQIYMLQYGASQLVKERTMKKEGFYPRAYPIFKDTSESSGSSGEMAVQ